MTAQRINPHHIALLICYTLLMLAMTAALIWAPSIARCWGS